jgi:hypothetical protein
MNRNLLLVLSVLGVIGLASAASAEFRDGGDGSGGGGQHSNCLCEEEIAGGAECGGGPCCADYTWPNCPPALTACPLGTECAAHQICVDHTVAGCLTDFCVPRSTICAEHDCIDSSGPALESLIDCYFIPTLSQWGLILFGMLLLTAMFLAIRRRGLPTHMTASLLVLGAVGLAVATAAYAQIQSERVCGESDVAVEFVNDILNG